MKKLCILIKSSPRSSKTVILQRVSGWKVKTFLINFYLFSTVTSLKTVFLGAFPYKNSFPHSWCKNSIFSSDLTESKKSSDNGKTFRIDQQKLLLHFHSMSIIHCFFFKNSNLGSFSLEKHLLTFMVKKLHIFIKSTPKSSKTVILERVSGWKAKTFSINFYLFSLKTVFWLHLTRNSLSSLKTVFLDAFPLKNNCAHS